MNSIKIPAIVETRILQLSDSLRAVNFSGNDYSVGIYRNIIRANIHEVLEMVYPLLVKELGVKKKKSLVDNFLLKHHASEAEFHKIATELICFFQDSSFLDTALSCLAEYEWLLYYLEIMNIPVNTGYEKQFRPNYGCNMTLKLNPTLKFIKLPFPIQAGAPVINQPGDFIYGLFKSSKDEILRKRLFSFDLLILNLIIDKKIILVTDLENQVSDENKKYFQQWIIENIVEEFIFLSDPA